MPFVSVDHGVIKAIKLEFNLTAHCNYSCAECSHLSPHMAVGSASLEHFKRDVEALKHVYRVKRFRFVGGEPLLNKEILAFIRTARDSGVAEKIQICTNGSALHKTDNDVLREIDMLSISWYPDSRCDQAKIDLAVRKCREYGTKLKIERIDKFRLMQIDSAIENPLLQQIFDSCQIAHTWGCQTFLDGVFYLCSRPLFVRGYLQGKGLAPPDFKEVDGCALHEPDLLNRLVNYLRRREPLESCKYCLGTVGKYTPWRQLTKLERCSTLPLQREAGESIDSLRMRYLLAWKHAERGILAVFPSLKLSRSLNLVENLPIRD